MKTNISIKILPCILGSVIGLAPLCASAQATAVSFGQSAGKAGMVDWTAGYQAGGDGFTGNFARAQVLMASLAQYAYDGTDAFASEATADGFQTTEDVHDDSLDAYAGSDLAGTMNFITIRGTDGVVDGLTDAFNIPTVAEDGITLHQGFAIIGHKAAASLQDAIGLSCTQVGDYPLRPLWITGHSLGAAAALIAAYDLARQGCYVAGVSVYGSPRPGLKDFRDAYNGIDVQGVNLGARTQRWVFENDPVYCVPPGGAWAHVGVENRISDGIHLATGEDQCTSPEDVIGKIRLGLNIVTLGAGDTSARFSGAIADFLAGLIDFGFQCRDGTRWDDLWSLGGCEAIDLSNRLVQTYSVSPDELITELIRLAYIKNHSSANYVSGMGAVDFTDNTQWVHMLVTINEDGLEPGQISMQESVTSELCGAEPDPQGHLACDFLVPVGYAIQLRIGGVDSDNLTPDICDWVNDPDNPTTPICTMVITGDTQITYNELPILL
jgi:hypothetical protein